MKYSELDKLAKERDYEIDRNGIRTKYRTRSNLIEIANDIPGTIYFATSKCGFLDIEFFKKCIELAETPLEDREDRRTFRFEISAHTEIDIIAEDLNEARKRADEIWHETFVNGLFGDVEFIKEVKED